MRRSLGGANGYFNNKMFASFGITFFRFVIFSNGPRMQFILHITSLIDDLGNLVPSNCEEGVKYDPKSEEHPTTLKK